MCSSAHQCFVKNCVNGELWPRNGELWRVLVANVIAQTSFRTNVSGIIVSKNRACQHIGERFVSGGVVESPHITSHACA